jgi:hypothetical protein
MQINIDGQVLECARPVVTIEKVGKAKWEPLRLFYHVIPWIGKRDVEVYNDKEIWTLLDAEVSNGHVLFNDVCYYAKVV